MMPLEEAREKAEQNWNRMSFREKLAEIYPLEDTMDQYLDWLERREMESVKRSSSATLTVAIAMDYFRMFLDSQSEDWIARETEEILEGMDDE